MAIRLFYVSLMNTCCWLNLSFFHYKKWCLKRETEPFIMLKWNNDGYRFFYPLNRVGVDNILNELLYRLSF